MAVAGENVNLRQQAEDAERGRWILELFREVGLPAAEVKELEGAEMHRHSGSMSRRGREPGHGWLLHFTLLAAAGLSIGNAFGGESSGALWHNHPH